MTSSPKPRTTTARTLTAWVLCTFIGTAYSAPVPPTLDKNAPLGSLNNPVRANMPTGQRDYLMRLRCPEGDAPSFERSGSLGGGPYGGVIDSYKLTCANGKTSDVIIDMYHRHREMQAVTGFTVLPEHPGRLAQGCPPQVLGYSLGSYVFNVFEVETTARAPGFTPEFNNLEVEGRAYAEFVIGADGRVRSHSIRFLNESVPKRLEQKVLEYLESFKFEPALHKPGCPVPQLVQVWFTAK
jgi:hypothetical protein